MHRCIGTTRLYATGVRSSSDRCGHKTRFQRFVFTSASSNRGSPSPHEPSTYFGFTSVPLSRKEAAVAEVFTSVASRYDTMNDLMSLAVHRWWKKRLVDLIQPQEGMSLLDVAGGTGDIAFRFVEEVRARNEERRLFEGKRKASTTADKQTKVTICDINPSMLAVGRERAIQANYIAASHTTSSQPDTRFHSENVNRVAHEALAMEFIEGNAEKLPFSDESFDVYTIAFGLRNVTTMEIALREAYRVLRKGGHFLCLEFSTIPNPVLQKAYDLYSFNVIPFLGELVAKDRASYQYLVESIRKFPAADGLLTHIEDAGFKMSSFTRLTTGIVAIHQGFKL